MSKELQIILIIASILFMLFILGVTKNKKMSFKHTLLWLFFSIIILIMAIFPQIVIGIAKLLFIETPTNAVFLIFIMLIIICNFYISIGYSKINEKVIALSQSNAILKKRVEELEHNDSER